MTEAGSPSQTPGQTSPFGLHRVVEPAGVLPQQAWRLDADPVPGRDEVVIDVERLNLDAASYRQLRETHGTGPELRKAVLDIVAERGKMQNPVTGSGGMLLGTVREVGPESPLGLKPGDRVATLVSLTLTPLRIDDQLSDWDGQGEQVPCKGTAVLFGRSIAAVLPDDVPDLLALSVFDVCGAPALTSRVVGRRAELLAGSPHGHGDVSVLILGGGGKSGSLSLAAARRAGAKRLVALVPFESEAEVVRASGLADEVVVADARDPIAVLNAVGETVDVTVVCVDVPGCEHGAVLATKDGGTVIFFSMATSFSAAALGAEGLAADVEMLVGNGYVPGHAAFALELWRAEPGVRTVFEARERQTSRS
ncbi:L-erythro-3,5-diaminohexanoate dehydrogenase [Allokutzneria sp. A3M-2-11 16]|uniref:L-erythro-3,5-diaminohexanoate dehydrogenase n=1 Tax=Allokutzneria sp. A3M-2-11 16 TaxID=2962043 RepID=UPI0020B868B9|nr:L-erythro-3,5-diaminohexanoate dehydrogenase [Allokutzneria sp. A3M-2-11 16]MCP3802384.1 L-erythro-3,5-diaminohexanoate dehydrogenase [Allokutzneria sp. A3M-2-11 16]